ncbi:rubrerythrin family protein [Mitsuokella sp. AF21-1AC]|uniref:rubrerythrin family protein n=1 Tax=Mitsuokella sp. AF21-1AC TaxID=2292235 RepID=UPI000E509E20|nr:ferritin family protein [Mitsuokella sp. AF21-1AC]RGS74819.1 rubrerythrin [Mitsuokella sp. AF21-1AC]
MSLNGIMKGTELEDVMKSLMQGEANGVMMYYALAQLAREQGFEDAAESFIEAANEEAVHAGFYAVLSGKYPSDFWGLVRGIQKAETNGEAQIKALADQVRAAGHAEAADQMDVFARQEGGHGVRLQKLLDKYQKHAEAPVGQKVYVCPVCGYEHVGDINDEDDSYVCPICGQSKSAFILKK